MKKYSNLKDFYPYYLSEHSDKNTKLMHFIGTALSIVFFINFLLTFNPVNILFGVLSGYGFAWIGHFFYEKNKPATFKYPLWSLRGDHHMVYLLLTGKIKQRLKESGVTV